MIALHITSLLVCEVASTGAETPGVKNGYFREQCAHVFALGVSHTILPMRYSHYERIPLQQIRS